MTPAERFRAKCITGDECWEWTGGKTRSGYSTFYMDSRMIYAHRMSYILHVGPVPDGCEIDHLCRNRGCVNPFHLEAVTHRENVLRGDTVPARHAAKTHCPQGHPYDEANTYRQNGQRRCRSCWNRTRSSQ